MIKETIIINKNKCNCRGAFKCISCFVKRLEKAQEIRRLLI